MEAKFRLNFQIWEQTTWPPVRVYLCWSLVESSYCFNFSLATKQLCCSSHPANPVWSSHIKAQGLFCFRTRDTQTEREERDRRWECSYSAVTTVEPPQGPNGFQHQEPCLCSKMYLFSYSFWELCEAKKDKWQKELFFLPQLSIPIPLSPLSLCLCIFYRRC